MYDLNIQINKNLEFLETDELHMNILKNINVSDYLYIPSKIENLDTYLLNYKEPLNYYDLEISQNDILNVLISKISTKKSRYISDTGWGCMVRSG